MSDQEMSPVVREAERWIEEWVALRHEENFQELYAELQKARKAPWRSTARRLPVELVTAAKNLEEAGDRLAERGLALYEACPLPLPPGGRGTHRLGLHLLGQRVGGIAQQHRTVFRKGGSFKPLDALWDRNFEDAEASLYNLRQQTTRLRLNAGTRTEHVACAMADLGRAIEAEGGSDPHTIGLLIAAHELLLAWQKLQAQVGRSQATAAPGDA